jgi:hypothetical protein
LVKPAGWGLVIACALAAIQGGLVLRVTDESLSEFGLEVMAVGVVARAGVYEYGSWIAAGVLLAVAAVLLHVRRTSFSSARSTRSLALRIAGLLPVYAAATTASFIAVAVVLSNELYYLGELVGSEDLVVAVVLLLTGDVGADMDRIRAFHASMAPTAHEPRGLRPHPPALRGHPLPALALVGRPARA